jgi:hypothetical protein
MMIFRAFIVLAPTLVAWASTPISSVSTLGAQEPTARAAESNADPARVARPHAATQATEKAVLDGLRWLVRHQDPDGSWSAAKLGERCAKESRCFDEHDAFTDRDEPAATGLALLCFLRAGFTDESKQDIVDTVFAKRHKVGDVVKSGLQSLVLRQHADGSFSSGRSFVYDEAIATLALVEAYAAQHEDEWKEPAQRGVGFLECAQRQSPRGDSLWGWRSDARLDAEIDARNAGRVASAELELSDSDGASTALCTFVLRAAQDAGLAVKAESLAGALAYTRAMTGELGDVAYRDARIPDPFVATTRAGFIDHPGAMAALGMCTRMCSAQHLVDPFLDLGAKRVIADLPSVSADKASIDYAYWYWGSLALHDLDGPQSPRTSGKYWRTWHAATTAAIVSLQDHSAGSCRNGGWIAPDRWSFALGPIYTTAMSILTLELEFSTTGALRGAGSSLRHGAVGMLAPPIDRVDANGDPFVLASLAGKVVVLDSCSRDELPDSLVLNLRDRLLERFKDRPLVLVGVCVWSGADLVVPAIARDRRATWRWIQAKSLKDPLVVDYALGLGKTIVIDAEGVIRMRDESWPAIVNRVEELVSQAEKK